MVESVNISPTRSQASRPLTNSSFRGAAVEVNHAPQGFKPPASPPPALVTPIPVPVPEPIQGTTRRRVVRVLSNDNGIMTFDGGMQIVSGELPYTTGDRVLLINERPAGLMQPEDEIEDVYLC